MDGGRVAALDKLKRAAAAQLARDDAETALRATRSILAQAPGDGEARTLLAACLMRLERAEEAIGELEAWVLAAPDDIQAHGALAEARLHQGDGRGAIEALEAVVARAPDWAEAHYNLANLLKDAGRPVDAAAAYRRAVALRPALRPAHVNLANTLLELGEIEAAFAAYDAGDDLRRGPAAVPGRRERHATLTTAGKLRHDIEQLDHLLAVGRIDAGEAWRGEAYRRALARIEAPPGDDRMVPVATDPDDPVWATHNRRWHKYAPARRAAGVLNPDLDRPAIEAAYVASGPGIAAIDGLLRPDALAELRRFCHESTIWHEFRYANGYLGAFMADGFTCPLLAQLADELREAFPAIFGAHRLRKTWAFKCDDHAGGVPLHADFAAVNVNFWITPDAANLDETSGGLTVWDKEAPLEWDFETYNTDVETLRAFIGESGARPVFIPYRENRVAIFNSDLLHETQPVRFRPGYTNRRINITMLYGKRQDAA